MPPRPALTVIGLLGVAAAQTLAHGQPVRTGSEAGTRLWVLGDAMLNIDTKSADGIGSAGIAIRGPEIWIRFFVSSATDSKTVAAERSRDFGRSVIAPEQAGRGANLSGRFLFRHLQKSPDTRLGGLAEFMIQDTQWTTSGASAMSSDGVTWGVNLGGTLFCEGFAAETNNILAYADLMLMARGAGGDFDDDIRQAALGTAQKAYGGFGLRGAFKVNQLLAAATVS